jgi:hypothetical protein
MCDVDRDHMGNLTVTFNDNKTIYLQTDYDRAAFLVACGLVVAPDNWDGQPDSLPDTWIYSEESDITECPNEYYDNAE